MIGILIIAGAAAMMPPAFRGDWALETGSCAPGPADSGNMRIAARKIVNFESQGSVVRVKTLDPRTIRLESRVTHGGGTFGSVEMLSLSADGRRLTIGEHSDVSTYKRCTK
jgi:hypothetical protein